MRSYSYKFMAISIALALGLNGGLPVLAEALSTEMVDIQDQVSEYVDEDEVNQEVHEISEEVKSLIERVDELPEVNTISEEIKEATILAFEEVLKTYEALSETNKVAFNATKEYTKMLKLKDELYAMLLMNDTYKVLVLERKGGNESNLNYEISNVSPVEGELVEVTVRTSRNGYGTAGIDFLDEYYKVISIPGHEISRSYDDPNKFTFIMPAQNVNLQVRAAESLKIYTKPYYFPEEGKATPASNDGKIEAVAFVETETKLEEMFSAWDSEAGVNITSEGFVYKFENNADYGMIDCSGNYLTYTPNADAAGEKVKFFLKGYIGGSVANTEITFTVDVGDIPKPSLSNDASLKTLSYSIDEGNQINISLVNNKYEYDIILPENTPIAKKITLYGVVNQEGANITKVVNGLTLYQKSSASLTIKAENLSSEQVYTVNFKMDEPDTDYYVAINDTKYSDGNTVEIKVGDKLNLQIYLGSGKDGAGSCSYASNDFLKIPLQGAFMGFYPNILESQRFTPAKVTTGTITVNFYKESTTDHKTLTPIKTVVINVEIVKEDVTITFDANEGISEISTMLVNEFGKLTTLPTAKRSGYRFDGWYTEKNGGSKVDINTVFIQNSNVYAHWTDISSSSSTGTIKNDVTLKPKVDSKGNATLTIKDKDIIKAIQNTKDEHAATIKVDSSRTINQLAIILPKSVQEQLILANVSALNIVSDAVTMNLDLEAIKTIHNTAQSDVTIIITKVNNKTLSSENQKFVDNRPLYDIKINDGDQFITTFPKGMITLVIPYETQRVDGNGKVSKTGRFEQASNLIGVYLDEQGKLHELLDSYYDNTSKKLIMHTDHLSTYGVAYKNTSSNLTDITNHWAKEEINFVVARGLLTGTNNQFKPDALISRGEFVAALAKLANADLSIYKTASFTDCSIEHPYFGAVEWATQYKLIDGAGNGLFAPSSPISRQTMALILSNYARVMGYILPSAQKEITFLDQALISSWAKSSVKDLQMAGIVMSKKNGNFDPLTSATRAETAMMLSRFIQANTSDGWKMNDRGEWMYFKNGQYLTGSRSIDGLTYKFDQYGVTQSLPKEKRYVLYIVQNGDTLRTLAKKHELSVTELATFNQLKTSDVLLVGDEIRIPKK